MKIKRTRRQRQIKALKVKKTFSCIHSLTSWVIDNITSLEKQEQYVIQGVKNNYEITVDVLDTATWVTRTPLTTFN